jgi:peptide/nickel transport system substrate-binding protein
MASDLDHRRRARIALRLARLPLRADRGYSAPSLTKGGSGMIRFQAAIAALAAGVAISLSDPAAAENVLRFTGTSGGAVTMDPHSFLPKYNQEATRQVYEALLDIDSNLAIVPQLALAWKPLDATTWEFELRPDVTFHDGKPFTATDVVFSIERARAENSDFRGYVAGIAAIEAIGDRTVRLTTTAPDPSLWLKLADVAIMSRAWAEQHNVTTPTDYNGAREETFASRHANGTGPFMVEAFEPRGDYALIRNPAWWGQADHPHYIDRVLHVRKEGDAEKLTALLEGEIDLLEAPPYSGLDEIRKNPDLKLVYRPKLYTAFFGFDQVSQALRTSDIKVRNPFKDERVREAIAQAINMETALQPLMGELFIPAGMIVAPGMNGYAPELDRPIPYDPEGARALLAEAGYPNGFAVTLDCPEEWGDDEKTACKAAAEQLGSIAIDVSINFLPTDELLAKVETRHDSDFFLESWDMDPDSERVLRELFHSESNLNIAGYANPRIDELLAKISVDMVTYARDAYLEEAWRIVTDELVYLPIRHGVSVFAMRKNLEIPPDPWDVPRFRLARFKEEGKSAQQ